MKKLFAAFALVLLAGGGCIGGEETPEAVTGDWYLTFDLPEGWAMTPSFDEGDPAPVDVQVTKETADIAIQGPLGSVTRVYRLSSRRALPDEAEDIGNGFFKAGDTEYYFVGTVDKFQFEISNAEQEFDLVEQVILSAKEVTQFNQ